MTIATGDIITTESGERRVYDTLLITKHGGRVALEQLEAGFQVRALTQLGYNPDVAKTFGYSGAERSKVVSLAQRKGIVQ